MTCEHALALILCAGSSLLDLQGKTLPNSWTILCAGLLLLEQLQVRGPACLPHFLAGMAVPFLLLFPVWLLFFGSVGAGDIKLMMALGGLLGPSAILICTFRTFLFGAGFSLLLLLFFGGIRRRFQFFLRYAANLRNGSALGNRFSYRRSDDCLGEIHMTIPLLMSVLLWTGGV